MSLTFIEPGSRRRAPQFRRRWLAPHSDDDKKGRKPLASHPVQPEHSQLPYRVELWDEAKASVEQVLAVTANSSIGYAAYFEATREHPNRYVTLRHKDTVLSRWNGPTHSDH